MVIHTRLLDVGYRSLPKQSCTIGSLQEHCRHFSARLVLEGVGNLSLSSAPFFSCFPPRCNPSPTPQVQSHLRNVDVYLIIRSWPWERIVRDENLKQSWTGSIGTVCVVVRGCTAYVLVQCCSVIELSDEPEERIRRNYLVWSRDATPSEPLSGFYQFCLGCDILSFCRSRVKQFTWWPLWSECRCCGWCSIQASNWMVVHDPLQLHVEDKFWMIHVFWTESISTASFLATS